MLTHRRGWMRTINIGEISGVWNLQILWEYADLVFCLSDVLLKRRGFTVIFANRWTVMMLELFFLLAGCSLCIEKGYRQLAERLGRVWTGIKESVYGRRRRQSPVRAPKRAWHTSPGMLCSLPWPTCKLVLTAMILYLYVSPSAVCLSQAHLLLCRYVCLLLVPIGVTWQVVLWCQPKNQTQTIVASCLERFCLKELKKDLIMFIHEKKASLNATFLDEVGNTWTFSLLPWFIPLSRHWVQCGLCYSLSNILFLVGASFVLPCYQ